MPLCWLLCTLGSRPLVGISPVILSHSHGLSWMEWHLENWLVTCLGLQRWCIIQVSRLRRTFPLTVGGATHQAGSPDGRSSGERGSSHAQALTLLGRVLFCYCHCPCRLWVTQPLNADSHQSLPGAARPSVSDWGCILDTSCSDASSFLDWEAIGSCQSLACRRPLYVWGGEGGYSASHDVSQSNKSLHIYSFYWFCSSGEP